MRQSNAYVLLFAVVMTIIIGGLMSLTSVLLKPAQQKQIELDTKKKILGAVMDISKIKDPNAILVLYNTRVRSVVVDIDGNIIESDAKGTPMVAEDINQQKNHKSARESRTYPVFMFMSENNPEQVDSYIFPMFGAGLWDWISGYVALDGDLNTIRGVAFDHRQETPGLGARITDSEVRSRYEGKKIFDDKGELVSITMVKGEGKTGLSAHQVDGMSGATLTAKGVNAMLKEYLGCYEAYISNLKNENKVALNQ